jgi:hypothetical protein
MKQLRVVLKTYSATPAGNLEIEIVRGRKKGLEHASPHQVEANGLIYTPGEQKIRNSKKTKSENRTTAPRGFASRGSDRG